MGVASTHAEKGHPMAVSAIHSRADVLAALHHASARTGIDFDYLLSTARRESGLNPQAEAMTSSAAGLFQFIEQTWLATVKAHGVAHGLSAYAEAITGDGRSGYEVADASLREEILALRYDPAAASAMAAELARDSARGLEARLGQRVDSGLLYAAHFLGLEGAAKLVRAAGADPDASAVALFPEAAAANRGVFYDSAGRSLSVSALLSNLGAEASVRARTAEDDSESTNLRVGEGITRIPAINSGGLGTRAAIDAGMSAYPPLDAPDYPARVGGMGASLRLTPEIIQILASFDPLPESLRRDARA
jgi:hypothetical protein